jgi:hypothetical protein
VIFIFLAHYSQMCHIILQIPREQGLQFSHLSTFPHSHQSKYLANVFRIKLNYSRLS